MALRAHQISEVLYIERRAARTGPGLSGPQRAAATATVDAIGEQLALLLPPAHRDAFLLASGIPLTRD